MLKTIGMELSEDQFREMIAAADTDGRFVSPFGRGSGGASVVVRLRVVVVADHMRDPRVPRRCPTPPNRAPRRRDGIERAERFVRHHRRVRRQWLHHIRGLP